PFRGQLAHQAVDLSLATHVHATRRFIKKQDVCLLMEEPRQRYLLLIAAAQFYDSLLRSPTVDLQSVQPTCNRLVSARQSQPARVPIGPQPAIGHVIGDPPRQCQTRLFAVFTEQAYAFCDPLGWSASGATATVNFNVATYCRF